MLRRYELVDDLVEDFRLCEGAGCVFLQIKYHLLHPPYLERRLRELRGVRGGGPRVRVVLCFMDAEERKALLEVNKTCLAQDATLLLAWSWEEAARYLETFKVYEHKAPTAIMERTSEDYMERLADALSTVRSVNKSDAATLASNFGTLRALALASREELALCPGLGGKKVERIFSALHAPFRSAAPARPGAPGALAAGQADLADGPSEEPGQGEDDNGDDEVDWGL